MPSGGQARLGCWAGRGGRWEEMSSGCGLAWQGSSRETISCESPSFGGTQEERPASRPGVRRVVQARKGGFRPAGAPGLVPPSQAGVSDAGLMSV